MPTVTYVNENKKIEVEAGDTVRYPALENDIPLYNGVFKYANCHGNDLCGSDRVEITPASAVTPPTFLEKLILKRHLKEHPNLRLACQAKVLADCEVRTVKAGTLTVIRDAMLIP